MPHSLFRVMFAERRHHFGAPETLVAFVNRETEGGEDLRNRLARDGADDFARVTRCAWETVGTPFITRAISCTELFFRQELRLPLYVTHLQVVILIR